MINSFLANKQQYDSAKIAALKEQLVEFFKKIEIALKLCQSLAQKEQLGKEHLGILSSYYIRDEGTNKIHRIPEY